MERYPRDEEEAPMESKTSLTSRREDLRAPSGRAASGALGAVTATAVALAALVVLGIISWDTIAGFQGVCIRGALGAVAGAALGSLGPRAARIIGGGIGGVVAGYFALASAEMLPPRTMQWALGGGGYAALFALPMAMLVAGLIGLLGAASRPVGAGNVAEYEGRPADHGGTDRR
jgi:hypothetical protein